MTVMITNDGHHSIFPEHNIVVLYFFLSEKYKRIQFYQIIKFEIPKKN